jgi:hypothetical protein
MTAVRGRHCPKKRYATRMFLAGGIAPSRASKEWKCASTPTPGGIRGLMTNTSTTPGCGPSAYALSRCRTMPAAVAPITGPRMGTQA